MWLSSLSRSSCGQRSLAVFKHSHLSLEVLRGVTRSFVNDFVDVGHIPAA